MRHLSDPRGFAMHQDTEITDSRQPDFFLQKVTWPHDQRKLSELYVGSVNLEVSWDGKNAHRIKGSDGNIFSFI